MEIAKNTVVSMRYIMKNSKGDVLENTMNSIPVSYLHGAAGILSLLQEQINGLKAGDKKLVYLYAGQGLTDDDFIFEIIIDQVSAATEEEILLGYPVRVNVPPCEADCNCYTTTP